MIKMKLNNKYTFTVEGSTEQWYLEWLQHSINSLPDCQYTVKIECLSNISPTSMVKRKNSITTPSITHLCDCETDDPEHTTKFQNIISDIKEANKQIKYSLGYSNISFELWLILHKEPCNKQFISPKQYLPILNRTFDEDFQALKEYKKEDNFKRCLSKLSLDDVKQAIKHANDLMKQKEQDCTIIKYKGIKYYKDNPALNVHEHIQKILEDCEIL